MSVESAIGDHPPHVRDVMTSPPIMVSPEATILHVVDAFARHNVGAVIVADGGRLLGIIAERDLLRRAGQDCRRWHQIPARDVMTRQPWTASPNEPWESALEALQQHCIRHMPVVDDGIVVGMLSIRDLMKHRTALLESLVQQRTAQLTRRSKILAERDREHTRSLRIAGRIQRHILPGEAPVVPGLQIAFEYHPLEQVAGDFFDFAFADSQTLLVAIGDAAGHGVPAAFIALIANTCLRSNLVSHASPAALLSAMNDCLYGWVETEHFVTMFVAAIDLSTRRMTFARAGHPKPLWIHADGRVSELEAEGIMLGVDLQPAFHEQSVQLHRGDKVLLYTDGLTECSNSADELFGTQRLSRCLIESQQKPGPALAKSLVAEARDFSGNRAFDDDLTLVVIEAS